MHEEFIRDNYKDDPLISEFFETKMSEFSEIYNCKVHILGPVKSAFADVKKLPRCQYKMFEYSQLE